MPIAAHRNRVYALVLAAGTSSRFGTNKQLVDFRGESLVRRATRLATAVCSEQVVLVLGHEWREVYTASRPISGGFVINKDYAQGIGTSIARGVAAIRHAADAVLIVLADQPLITAAHLRDLRSSWSGKDREIVASAFAGTTGVPALIPTGGFDSLCSLRGNSGAQSLMHDPDFSLRTVDFAEAALDVDTPEDLVRAENNAHN